MAIQFLAIVVGAQLLLPVADGVPRFDVTQGCRLDNAAVAGLADTQSANSCVRDEQRARIKHLSNWSKFPHSNRASCVAEEYSVGPPSYVDLLTCLQMDQWVR
jgi:hypothetical protein